MTQGCDTGIHANPDPRRSASILEVSLFRLGAAVLLESLKKFEQNFLGDFTPSSFQVGKARKSEIGVQVMSHRVEGTSHGRFRLLLDLCLERFHLGSLTTSLKTFREVLVLIWVEMTAR